MIWTRFRGGSFVVASLPFHFVLKCAAKWLLFLSGTIYSVVAALVDSIFLDCLLLGYTFCDTYFTKNENPKVFTALVLVRLLALIIELVAVSSVTCRGTREFRTLLQEWRCTLGFAPFAAWTPSQNRPSYISLLIEHRTVMQKMQVFFWMTVCFLQVLKLFLFVYTMSKCSESKKCLKRWMFWRKAKFCGFKRLPCKDHVIMRPCISVLFMYSCCPSVRPSRPLI